MNHKSKTYRVALTAGLVWGGMLFVLTLLNVYTGYAEAFLEVVMSLYPGYTLTSLGSLVGLVYGLIDAFVGVYIFAWLYHRISR